MSTNCYHLLIRSVEAGKQHLKCTYFCKIKMKTVLLISPILFALLHTVFCDSYAVYYIDKACPSKGTKVQYILKNSGRKTAALLKASKKSDISSQDCWLSFGVSSQTSKILFSIRKIDFKKSDCSKYYIEASAGVNQKKIKTFCKYQKDDQESESYFTNTTLLLFHIFTVEKTSADVEIVATAYSDVRSNDFNYKCNNNKYISSSLTCDGHNNCGDKSDEMNCKRLSPGIISGIVIGCLLIIAAISGAIWCFCRRSTRTTYVHT